MTVAARRSRTRPAALACLLALGVLVAATPSPSARAQGTQDAASNPAAPCFTSSDPTAIAAGCDVVLAKPQGYSADHLGVARQRRGGARAALGRIDEAIGDFREMAKAEYKPHEAHASIASLLFRRGKLAEAETSYRQALQLNPSYGLAHSGLGQTLIALGRANDAIFHFNQAIDTSDTDINAHFGKGIALFTSGDLDGAIASLGAALKLNPKLLPALYQRAQALNDKGDTAGALGDADAAVEISSGVERVRALSYRGRLRNNAKRYKDAVSDCDEAAKLAASLKTRDGAMRAAAYICLGLARQNQGLLAAALDDYNRALQWDIRDSTAYAGRGYVQLQRGRFDAAIADFKRALEIDPRSRDALRFLGLTYADKGDVAKAQETFGRAIEIDPKDPWPYMIRAVTVAKGRDRDRALADVGAAMAIVGDQNSDAMLVRGAVHYFLNDLAAARRDIDRAIALNDGNAQAYRMLGRLLIKTGGLEQAEAALKTAEEKLPNDHGVILNQGLLALARKDYPTALRQLTRSLAINAAHAEGFAARGQTYEAQGRNELAIADYRSAATKLATDQDGKDAKALAAERLAALLSPPPPPAPVKPAEPPPVVASVKPDEPSPPPVTTKPVVPAPVAADAGEQSPNATPTPGTTTRPSQAATPDAPATPAQNAPTVAVSETAPAPNPLASPEPTTTVAANSGRPAAAEVPQTAAVDGAAAKPEAKPRSAYCRFVEAMFAHSRRYTGVDFNFGCTRDN